MCVTRVHAIVKLGTDNFLTLHTYDVKSINGPIENTIFKTVSSKISFPSLSIPEALNHPITKSSAGQTTTPFVE